MKSRKLFTEGIFVLFLFIWITAETVNAQCIPNEITFSSQIQIDNFATDYPGCTEILGDVYITESSSGNITNLNGLSVVNSIGGELDISFNSALSNLNGLGNLTSIGEDMQIYYCDALTNLNGLENLTSIGGSVDVEENPALISLNGLENLTYIGKTLYIIYNTSLSSISGLSNLTLIGEGLDLVNNNLLPSLSGLDNLTSIGGNVRIINTGAVNLSNLSNLLSIGGSLEISYNNLLSSLEGIDNIDPSTITYLVISGCPVLSVCEVQSICDYLDIPESSTSISSNASGCNNKDEVVLACTILAVNDNVSETNEELLFPNPTNGIIHIDDSNSDIWEFTIYNTTGLLIRRTQNLENGQIDISNLPNGLYFIELSNKTQVIIRKIIKE